MSQSLGTILKLADQVPKGADNAVRVRAPADRSRVRQGRFQRETLRRQHHVRRLPVTIDHTTQWYLDPRNAGLYWSCIQMTCARLSALKSVRVYSLAGTRF